MTDLLHSAQETGWLVRDASGTAMAFMNLSLWQDYVPGATQRPVAFEEGIYVPVPDRPRLLGWRFLLGLRFLRLLSNQGTPVIVSHGCGQIRLRILAEVVGL